MKITSMLSNGYLQPVKDVNAPSPVEEQRAAAALSAQEQQVLAQERALTASSGPEAKVSTTYSYSIGPDGRRYITGAYVSIKSDDRLSDAAPSGGEPAGTRKKADPAEKPEKNKEAVSGETDMETDAAVRELKRIEQEVISHEAAHQAAGGGLTGAVSYTYTQGPDGKRYITGGEVSIHVPASSDPEQTMRDMEQVQRAALAPSSPSSQDIQVAAKAAATAANARQELSAKIREESAEEESEKSAEFSPGISSVRAGLLFERIHGENQGEMAQEEPLNSTMLNPMEAYERNASSRGLWTFRRGFEPVPKMDALRPNFDIAA